MIQTQKTAVLLVGHGSPDTDAVEEFINFSQEFKRWNGFAGTDVTVENAFLEISEPSIPQSLHRLSKRGIEKIIVVPYFLFRAKHVKTEIPEIVEEFQKNQPHVKIVYSRSLWPHKNLVQLARKRILDGIESFPSITKNEVDILVVGRGATDREAITQFSEVLEQLKAQIVCRKFQHCFIAVAEPKYAQILPELFQNGTQNLIIFPFNLFTGILVKRIESQAKNVEKNLKKVTIKVLPHFGMDPLMFQIVNDRIKETAE